MGKNNPKSVPTKFRVVVDGKDSAHEGVLRAASARLEARPDLPSDDQWDELLEREVASLHALVKRFVSDGNGGNDRVTLEFDTATGACSVVPIKSA